MSLDTMDDRIDAPLGKHGLRGGLIMAAVSIVLSLILYFAGLATEQWAGFATVPVVLIVLFLLQKKFRDQEQGGFLAFGKAWRLGFIICAISTVFSAIYTYCLYKFDGSLVDAALEKAYEDMMDQGMTTSQVDQAMEMTEKFMTPGMMVVWVVVFGLIFSLIWPLITSAIVQRKHPLD